MTASKIRRKLTLLISALLALTVYTSAPYAAESDRVPKVQVYVKKPKEEKKEPEQFGPFLEKEKPQEEVKEEPVTEKKAEKEKEVQPEAAKDVQVADAATEGAGFYQSAADGSLGIDLWKDMDRASITKLMRVMPVASQSPAIQKLIFGILYTKTDVSLVKNGEPPLPGEDLFTLRMEKMLEAGAYRQALNLYSGLALENPPVSAARKGVMAMLFSGEKSLACLELNTVRELHPEDDFFNMVSAYCDVSLSDAPSDGSLELLKTSSDKLLLSLATQKDFTVTYTPAFFDKYTLLEQAILAGEQRIVLSGGYRNFKDVPPSHLQIIMANSVLSPKEKFILNVRALEWGLMRTDEYKKALLSLIDIDARKDPALTAPQKGEDWQKLPYYLQIATNKTEDADVWANIKLALPMAKTYGTSALIPFGELIYRVTPQAPTFEEMHTAVNILSKAGFPVPRPWAEIIENHTPTDAQKPAYTSLLAAVYLSEPDNKTQKNKDKLASLYGDAQDAPMFFVKSIIENIDNPPAGNHTSLEIYENNNDLTFQQDYVMPSMGVWNRLIEASKEGHIGETVLLSTATLREIPLREVHPALFQDVVRSLKSVGLTEISRALAIEAVLGSTDE
jgi:hypothetical protein